MDNKIKNLLGLAIILGILIFSFAAWNYVEFYSKSIIPSSFRSFSVFGEGKITAIPDVAKFSFSIITEGGKNIADFQKENTAKVNKIIDFIKSKGVEAKDIKTQNYNLNPRYQYYSCPNETSSPCPPPDIVGHTITQTVSVKIRDFTKIGDVLSGVVLNGANSVSQLYFTVDDLTDIQSQARAEAIKKAKDKANEMAKAGEFKVGKLLEIWEEGGYTPPIYKEMPIKESAGAATPLPAPAIEPGSQEITVNVTLRYEIE